MKVVTRVKSLIAAAVAAAGLVAFAEPVVEITKAWQANPGSGVVDFTYEVRDLDGASCDLVVRVEAKGCDKTYTFTNENVSAGLTTTNVDYKTKLGMVSPNVSIYASLVKCQMRGVQLWEGGPYWAECNVGAKSPEETGYYFWWGDTVGYVRNESNNGWVSSQDGTTAFEFKIANPTASQTYNHDNTWLKANGWIGEDGNLVLTNDAARAHLKGDWRMPTSAELDNLLASCDRERTVRNGVEGYIVKGKGDYSSKSIFLPKTGYGLGTDIYKDTTHGCFWTSTPYMNVSFYASYIGFDYPNSLFGKYNNVDRYCAMPVRPVRDAK